MNERVPETFLPKRHLDFSVAFSLRLQRAVPIRCNRVRRLIAETLARKRHRRARLGRARLCEA